MTVYEELVKRGLIAQVTDEEEIKELINNGKATFYIGFDPTADSLHVGHFMALCLMKRLQMAGNKPIALVGGGTGMIGDPSGRTDLRQMMTVETINENCERFKEQMSRFIDFSDGKALMVNNADWLRDLNYIDFIRDIGSHFSVNRMLTFECYKQRMEKGLSFLEFNYMIMQSYDFYRLYKDYGCNMQFGGDDQWSNMLGGTELIRRKLGKDAYAMTITLLLNSEGKKMGKTASGAVWLDPNKTSPFDFYQYWRNVGDEDVIKCLKMLTFLPLEEIEKMEKWEGSELNKAKEILAYELTELVHGEDEADKAKEAASALFKGKGSKENMPSTDIEKSEINDGISLLDLMLKAELIPSKSEGRRLVKQGGVSVDDIKITDVNKMITLEDFKENEIIIKKGKKVYHKINIV
ncbi:tyrosine--tRNA ligase [Anaerofustis stercorihominis]|uniref:Tyrosine--tRNA ligase n=1 Tax=Anaerofustis stercorihominis DSM 17244 TaxID=445971 RepID=B1CAF3_9FIRM|nr:tyrosine--tRNA ligase [Anaerofustis stercorihominis]EDS72426.1 tyrosine--tRNA ligase [Anaerofustis stercorihominis DSM 17244]MCQ4795430.1 tyrosine--tRNA ligase [Anaerofustis stercorihominis]